MDGVNSAGSCSDFVQILNKIPGFSPGFKQQGTPDCISESLVFCHRFLTGSGRFLVCPCHRQLAKGGTSTLCSREPYL